MLKNLRKEKIYHTLPMLKVAINVKIKSLVLVKNYIKRGDALWMIGDY